MWTLSTAENNLSSTELGSPNKWHSQMNRQILQLCYERTNQYFSQAQLDALFRFQHAWYLDHPDAEQCFDNLGPRNRQLACLDLRKKHKLQSEPVCPENFRDFRDHFAARSALKRNEEKNKIVFKNTFKALEKMFSYKLTDFIMAHNVPRFRDYLRDKKSAFYLDLFWETVVGGRVHEDLLMDILYERVSTGRPRIERKDNWRSMRKPVSMKKVSAAMRYLIKQDGVAKQRILEFMEHKTGRGLVVMMREEIAKKLKNKRKLWASILKKCEHRFDEFSRVLMLKINSYKFKNPWTMKNVRAAIDHCVAELNNSENTKLRNEYIKIRRYHYSRTD